jgi:hypothetical protein
MIPTLILAGLIFGRWWKATLIGAAIGWPLLLIATGVDIDIATTPVAAALGAANAALGVLVHRLLRLVARGLGPPVRVPRDVEG